MIPTPKKGRILSYLWIVVIIFLCCGLPGLYYAGRPLPIETRQELYEGVVYYRRVHFMPQPMIAHIITVDLKSPGLRFIVTPPDYTGKREEYPLKARTSSQFLKEFGVQIAVNGDGFTPWYNNSLFDFYPHIGDPVKPNGFAASRGKPYSDGIEPTLYISINNVVQFGSPRGKIYNAISGDRMLIIDGALAADLPDELPAPRSAIGYDHGPSKVIIIVVDGRQPFYSEGATLQGLAELLIYYGAEFAMNLDGGGSSTLVVSGPFGTAKVLNSPINNHIPGRERPVANHLGIFVGE